MTYVAAQELEWYLFGTLYLLAAGYTLLHDEHIRVDIIYSKLTPRQRARLNFVLFWIFFFPSCLLVIYTAWPFVRNSWRVWEGSPDPGGIRGRWALKSMIIVGFVLLLLQGISETVKAFYRWRGWEAVDEAPKEVH
jgi:TRAP-type mannitol/chloroaromatic compound transport system permease small subunit